MTYATLQDDIARMLDKPEAEPAIPAFIRLAEACFRRDVRHWRMEKRSETTLNERFELVPSDWLATIRFGIKAGAEIELVPSAKLQRMRRDGTATGVPIYYAISAGQFEFYPTPTGQDGELLYYAAAPALSDSATSNWLLEDAPDAYLYGALMHSAPYVQDDARVALWQSLYGTAVQRLNEDADRARWSGPLRMRVK